MSLLIYGYATGVFSSRRIKLPTYDSVAFRHLACNRHPDHDTLATFRRRFGDRFQDLFVQVLQIAQANRLSRFGTVSLDGTKIHANASRHSALSYGHADKLEAKLKQEVRELLALAEAADQSELPEGLSVPAEIARREDQLKAIAAAKARIEARAKARYEKEKAEFDAKLAAREARAAKTGKKPGGKPPTPPSATPRAQDQVNLTDEDSRIMKVAGGGFDQCYNAQALVNTESMLVLVPEVTQAANDKQQVEPMLEKLEALPAGLNAPATLLADSGYFSEANVAACREAEITPADRPRAGGPPPALAATLRGTRADCRGRERGGADASHPEDPGRQRGLCATQADGGAGVRHHQVGDALPAVPAARPDQRPQRMDAGVPGVEFETHGRIAPELRLKRVKQGQEGINPVKSMP